MGSSRQQKTLRFLGRSQNKDKKQQKTQTKQPGREGTQKIPLCQQKHATIALGCWCAPFAEALLRKVAGFLLKSAESRLGGLLPVIAVASPNCASSRGKGFSFGTI